MLGREIIPLLHELEACGVKYCILGGESLPETLPGSDIDLLLDYLSPVAVSVFETHGFIRSKGVQVFRGSPAVFCKYVSGFGWIPIHVIERSFNGLIIAPEGFDKYTFVRDGLRFAADELYTVVLVSQSAIKCSITEKRLNRLREKWEKRDLDRDACCDLARKIDKRLEQICTSLFAVGFKDTEDVFVRASHSLAGNRSILKRATSLLRRKCGLGIKRGQILALEGIDGSGKTTFVGKVNGSIPKDGKCLFLISGMAGRNFGKWSRKLRSYWRASCERTGWRFSLVKNGMLPLVLLIEIWNCYALYWYAMRKKYYGYNVIFDRYSYLHYVRQVVHNKQEFLCKHIYIRLLSFFLIEKFPAPDLLLYLDLSPIEAISRKQEDDLGELEAKYELYKKYLLPIIDKKTQVMVIPATNTPNEMADNFLAKFWIKLV